MNPEDKIERWERLRKVFKEIHANAPPIPIKTTPKMNMQQILSYLAQTVIDSDVSGRCNYCTTGYCYGSHEADCPVEVAKLVLSGEYKFEEE